MLFRMSQSHAMPATKKGRAFMVDDLAFLIQKSTSKWCILYIPGTQMTLVLVGKGHVLGGLPSKIEVIWVLGIYVCVCTCS